MSPLLRRAALLAAAWACAASAAVLPAPAANEAATPAALAAEAVAAPSAAAVAATSPPPGLPAGAGCGPFVLPVALPYSLPCPAQLPTYNLATVPGSPYYSSNPAAPAGQAPGPTAGPQAARPTPGQAQSYAVVSTVVWDSPQSTAFTQPAVYNTASLSLVPDEPYTRLGLVSPPRGVEVLREQTTLVTATRSGEIPSS